MFPLKYVMNRPNMFRKLKLHTILKLTNLSATFGWLKEFKLLLYVLSCH